MSAMQFFSRFATFFSKTKNRRLSYLVIIGLIALGDFLYLGLARRTFLFYSNNEGKAVVEDRLIRQSGDQETDIHRYIGEALLGPVSPDLAPLFPRDTRLSSFIYSEGVVYVDLSESAVLPSAEGNLSDSSRMIGIRGFDEGGIVFQSLLTLNEGIRRNFPVVKNVRLFIGGNEVFFEEFRRIFADPADNSKIAPQGVLTN